MKKIILFISIFILLASFASAVTYPNGTLFYNFETGAGNLDDIWGSNDGVVNGMTYTTTTPSFNISGTNNYAGSFDGTNDYVVTTNTLTFTTDDSFTIAFWHNGSGASNDETIIGSTRTLGTGSAGFIRIYEKLSIAGTCQGKIIFNIEGVTNGNQVILCPDSYSYSPSYTHHTIIYNSTSNTCLWYLNATSSPISLRTGTCNLASEAMTGGGNNGKFTIGVVDSSFSDFNKMQIDNVMIFRRVLTSPEIQNIYNYGQINVPPIKNFELTLINAYNLTSINSFTAVFTNTTGSVSKSTLTGNISTIAKNQIFNITIHTIDSNTYFNFTVYNWNTSTDLEARAVQSVVNLILINFANTTQYNNVNWTINNTIENISRSRQTSAFITTFNATQGAYNYSTIKTGYPDTEGGFTLSPLDNITVYAEVGFFAALNFIDEKTFLPFNFSNTNTSRVTVVCSDVGSFEYILNESMQNISISCEYTKLRFTITYDNTQYTRNLLSSETDLFSQDIYLMNLLDTQSIYNAFVFNDYIGEYTNPQVYIKKNIEGAQVVIHSDDLDVENKISVFLIENDEYIIELRSSNMPNNVLGFYGADISGTKEITVTSSNIDTNPPTTTDYGVTIYSYAYNISDYLHAYASFSDTFTETTSVTWSLWYLNNTNGSLMLIYNVTSLGNYGSLIFTPYNISTYINYSVFSALTYLKDGETFVFYTQINDKPLDKKEGTLFGYYAGSIIQWGVIIFLSVIALSGTITTQNYVNYVIIGIAGILGVFNLFSVSIILLILGLVINFIYNIKTSEETRIAR